MPLKTPIGLPRLVQLMRKVAHFAAQKGAKAITKRCRPSNYLSVGTTFCYSSVGTNIALFQFRFGRGMVRARRLQETVSFALLIATLMSGCLLWLRVIL